MSSSTEQNNNNNNNEPTNTNNEQQKDDVEMVPPSVDTTNNNNNASPGVASPSQIVFNTTDDNFLTKDIPWHHMTIDETVKKLRLDPATYEDGHSPQEILRYRQKFGANTVPMPAGRSFWMILLANFANIITLILGVVVGVSIWLQDYAEVGVVTFVIIFNGALGTYQEYGSEKAAAALKEMTVGTAKLRRNGTVVVVDIQDVTVGDIVVLDQGATCPCDIRVIESHSCQMAEDALTGEPHPISKIAAKIDPTGESLPLGDRKNMAYRQTTVVNGTALGIAVSVGEQTELGKISSALAEDTDNETTLQRSMRYLMYILFLCCGVIVVIVFAANRFDSSGSTIIYACAVAIAVLPEALLAVITVAMTVSMKRMAELKCIVKKLNALEVLASTTDICSDKTGTLTQNVMTVRYVQVGAEMLLKVDAQPRMSSASMSISGTKKNFNPPNALRNDKLFFSFVRAAALNASCDLVREDDSGVLKGAGNPSEVAIQSFTWQCGLPQYKFKDELNYRPRGVFPFSSETKMMTVGYFHPPASLKSPEKKTSSSNAPNADDEDDTITEEMNQTFESSGDSHIFVKGAPERVLKRCTMTMRANGQLVHFTDEIIKVIEFSINELAKKGLRCIAVAEKPVNSFDLSNTDVSTLDREVLESDLIFLGLTGIFDPPRVESLDAVRTCQAAGIRVHMLTGDHLATATKISEMINIVGSQTDIKSATINGPDFDVLAEGGKLEDRAIEDMPLVIGRCSPMTKVYMTRALKAKGAVVAMTGDGTNDAPSIKDANIGMAMGSGVDLTKGVADLIICDDKFSTIVRAVAEGRRIRSSLSKFVIHLLSGNVSEVVALVIGLAIQHEERSLFTLSPVMILLVNTFTGIFPAMGLTADAPDPDLLIRPPAKGSIITAEVIADTICYGVILGVCTLGSFLSVFYGINDGADPNAKDCNSRNGQNCESVFKARTTAFVVLYIGLLLHAYNVRHARNSVFQMKWFDNAWLYMSIILNTLALIPIIYIEEIVKNVFLGTRISYEWGIIVAFLVAFMFFAEIYKLIKNAFWPLEYGKVEEVPDLIRADTIVLPQIQSFEAVNHFAQFVAPVDNNLNFTFADLGTTARTLVDQTHNEIAKNTSFAYTASPQHKLPDDGAFGSPAASPAATLQPPPPR